MTKRDITLDIAKGIGILLVVLGHGYSTGNGLYYWIGSFHMPLFFIATGIVYGMKAKNYTISTFPTGKMVCSLIIPYLVWAAITQSFLGMLKMIGGAAPAEILTTALLQILRGNAGFLWFLPTLFLAEFLFYLLSNDRLRAVGALTLGSTGLFCKVLFPGAAFDLRVLVAFFFICVGYFGHRLFRQKMNPVVIGLCACVSIVLGVMNGEVIIPGSQLGNPLIFVITALAGTALTLQFSMHMSDRMQGVASVLSWLGRNSIVILCTHNILTETIRLLDHKTLGFLPTAGVAEGFIIASLTMAALIPTIELFNRYFYWSFGKPRKAAASTTAPRERDIV